MIRLGCAAGQRIGVAIVGRGVLAPLFLAAFAFIILLPAPARALPFFSRQIGRDCAFCHTIVPKLNETGRTFRSDGYRLPGELEWKAVKDFSTLPASIEVETEAAYNKLKSNGAKKTASDEKVEELVVTSAAPMGKDGKVSAMASFVAAQTSAGNDARISKGFVQVNDLIGGVGEGRLNVRGGQWDIGLPFLNTVGQPIFNKYLAEGAMNVLTLEQRALEVNGSVVAEDGTELPTQRYSLGLARNDVNGDNKLQGLYATYAVTFKENYNAGIIYRTGREKYGSLDVAFNKYALAAEGVVGPFTLTGAYFLSNREGAPVISDYMAEALYAAAARVTLGARLDLLKETGYRLTKAHTLSVRYSIMSNVFAELEYRGRRDRDHAAGANDSEDRFNLYLNAAF